MILLSFILYRFVCDVKTFAGFFVPDEVGRRIPETASFACHWLSVPRERTTLALESAGKSAPFFFKTHGAEMTLSLNNTMGSLLMEEARDVVAFRIMPTSCVGDPIPVLAKGTLDPLPFLGKPGKNYAIKLRGAGGQVVGKLLFSLEVREADRGNENNGLQASSAHYIDKTLRAVSSSNERCRSLNGKPDAADGRQNQSILQDNLGRLPSFSTSLATPRESAENLFGKQSTTVGTPCSQTRCDGSRLSAQKSCLMKIDIERIVVKTERTDADSPAPFLLGGLYYLKVRYCGTVLNTPNVECRDPKEIVFSHHATFCEMKDMTSERFRFSLWENKLQVAGFSLDSAKFRIVPGVRKEYTIPFLYYPTKQAVSLEVTVCRTEGVKEVQKPPHSELMVTETEAAASVHAIWTDATTQPPLLQSTCVKPSLAKKLEERGNTSKPFHSSLGTTEFVSSLSNNVANKEPEVTSSKRLVNDFVVKRHSNSGARQSHWDVALRRGADDSGKHQSDERRRADVTNKNSDFRRSFSSDGLKKHCVSDVNFLYVKSDESGRKTEKTGGSTQTFLDRIVHHSSRSSSATRQPVRGLELPRAALSHRSDVSKMTEGSRDGTPLRGSAGFGYSTLNHEEREKGLFFNGSADHGYLQRGSMWGSSGVRGVFPSRQGSPELISDDFECRRDGKFSVGSLLSHTDARAARRTSLLEEWMEWRRRRATTRHSQAGSVRSEYSRDDSVDSILSRNRATSPRPTKSFVQSAEQRPYQPRGGQRSASRGSATPGIPPRPIC